jgi:serine phosphatase RsbU (regulator of sigma subunit)
MKKFVSIRTKLIANTMITISLIFFIVLSVVTAINIRSVNQNINKSERNIRNSLIVRGNTLINNNSMSMTGMVEDNAFTAIRNLVAANIKDDPDILYGLYMDMNRVVWAYASPENPSGRPGDDAPLKDDISLWAGSLEKSDYKTFIHRGREVIEFASPVFVDKKISGFIRYGISTESMHKLVHEALADGIRTRNITIAILLFLGLGSLTVSYFIVRRLASKITQPIESLVNSAMSIASGNYNIPVTSDSNDELGQLVSDVDKMRRAIKDLTENLEAKVEERTEQLQEVNQKLESAMSALWGEMELAKKIQSCLLPKKPEIVGYEIAASCEPAEEVGGDYYDVISVGDYDWIVIGDVSGHGITAGLVMMMVQTAIHTVLVQNPEVPPSQLLWIINRIIYENIVRMDEQKHMTIIVLAVEKQGLFSFSGLHEDILVWRMADKKVERIKSNGMWIGMDADISKMVLNETLKLEPDDCMVLYTDGVIEARSMEDGSFFGEERLSEILRTSGSKSSAKIHADILQMLKPYQKSDDVTLFVMKRV